MNHDIPVSIGTIELSNVGEHFFAEMSPGSVDLANMIGFCSIEIWPNEGLIPHFHIIPKDPKVAKKWECCVCLYKVSYFKHRSKQGTLTNKQAGILYKWLKEPMSIRVFTGSRWQWLCANWEMFNNPSINVPTSTDFEQPDYRKLNL